MPDNCQKIESLLPDYLEGSLTGRNHRIVEAHLAVCADCRESLELQREWLACRDAWPTLDDVQPSPGLNERIMAAVHAEHAKEPANRKTIRVSPAFWRGAAGVTAALVVLVAGWQILPRLFLAGSSATAAIPGQNEAAGLPETCLADDVTTGGSSKLTSAAGNDGWLVLDDQLGGSAALETRDMAIDSQNYACSSQFAVLNGLLAESSDLRMATRSYPTEQMVILAAYTEEESSESYNQIDLALSTCETPTRTEIIRREDLADLLDSLDPALYDQLFPTAPTASTWIFILIGA